MHGRFLCETLEHDPLDFLKALQKVDIGDGRLSEYQIRQTSGNPDRV
jgi:hypothetical protein